MVGDDEYDNFAENEIIFDNDTTNSIDTHTTIKPIYWNIQTNDLYPSQLPLEYKLTIFTDDSASSYIGHITMDYSSSSKIRAINQPDKTITKYSLVLFDFDSPNLTDENKYVLDKYIIPNIKYNSSIDVYGYTDKIGNPDYNVKLSAARANAVKDYILTKNRNVKINTYGLGSESDLFDNASPTGRQLSRTVQVLIVNEKE
jgi:outer membrane protein OmpA-like peptidoglycan-associated protein